MALERFDVAEVETSRAGFKHWRKFSVSTETNAPCAPQGNAIAESGFDAFIGIGGNLLLGAPHHPYTMWTEAVKAAVRTRNHTPTAREC